MIKTKYTKGFEAFWVAWKNVTGKVADKPEAFKYWKRDKLEGDEDELIKRLNLQQAERKRLKAKREWIPEWCFCRKWLNNRRYEYAPEEPQRRFRVCCCGCGREGHMIVDHQAFASEKCRIKILGW